MTRPGWIPEELLTVQPYSLGPLYCWDPAIMRAFPARSSIRMDLPERDIVLCFIAPARIQRMAQRAGERAMIGIRPRGIELIRKSKPDDE